MQSISYADVFDLDIEDARQDVRVGDVVCMGLNLSPKFEVIAISGDKAWVRNLETGQDALAPLRRCRIVLSRR